MTELIWDGKYDDRGRKTSPLRVALPFQTVETVNESTADRERTLNLFAEGKATDWRNRLIWGDKKYVLPSLLSEFAGQVNLIYIDPPFDTGADFSFTTTVPDSDSSDSTSSPQSFTKEPSIIEQKAYRDTWGRGLDSYLQWFYETIVLLHELLHETGSIYVHVGSRVTHVVRAIMDEVFGRDNYRAQIIWNRTSAHANVINNYGAIHDAVMFYTKSEKWTWNQLYAPYTKEYVELFFDQVDETGRRYARRDLTASMSRASSGQLYTWKGITPTGSRCWAMTKENMDELDRQRRIHWPKSKGGMPRLKFYADEAPGIPLQDIWDDISIMHNLSSERVTYPTQKPEALLERIIKASTRAPNETYVPDLVLDCFCGSGTTAAVAEKLGRRWIACDLGRFAIHTTRKRLLQIPKLRPFVVENLGKYERQAWAITEFGDGETRGQGDGEQRQRSYVEFILKLHQARPIAGYTWLHGVKAGRMVHVGAVEAPVSVGDVRQIATEFRRAVGTGKDAPTTNGVDVLGWDFAFELNEVARQQAAAANINMRFLRIPRDVMDKRAVEQGDIHFFELAALAVETTKKAKTVTVKLTNFIIPPDDVPEDVRRAVKHWEQWIDYWAVDFDNHGDTFHNEWQTYRTRKDKTLLKQATHTYEQAGEYTIMVKVIDILGNDTTKTVRVKV